MSRQTKYMRGKVKPLPQKGLGGCLLALPTQRPTTPRALASFKRARRRLDRLWSKWRRKGGGKVWRKVLKR